MAHIDSIINQMGYAESSNLKYKRDDFGGTVFSAHTTKVLHELSPYAVYLIDHTPFIMFFEANQNQDNRRQINTKIWNAQIPIAIICETGDVKIYNGCSIDKKDYALEQLESFSANAINENSPFSYWDITNQTFWQKYSKQLSGERLNDCLLRNLTDITEKLHNVFGVSFATRLMLRLIFIRYLIDRGVDLDYIGFSSDVQSSRESFLKLLGSKEELYHLFSHLKNKFNGNLFELNDECSDPCLTADVLGVLHDFLSANIDTKTGQLSFFDMYDFNMIPVELISNIYEILLGKEKRKTDNAFYTPHYLVNYILDRSIAPFVRDNGACKVLDPSCGSGIFLVESFRRMIEKVLHGAQFTEDNVVLQRILSENIYGVDLNPDAIDVAIFSLYLAILDYKNPKTLNKFTLPNLKGENLFAVDFFDEKALIELQAIEFDFIVGNPPWGSGGQLQTEYCKKQDYKKYMQNNDTCRAFILRSKDFSNADTQCCFILHSKLLYMQKQPSKNFRRYFLNNAIITGVVELSSVRKLVFKNADAPAVILSYRFSDENVLENRFQYISMKPNIFFRLFNLIVIEKNDVKFVGQKLLAENDWAWKTLVYGLSGDINLIINCKKAFPTIKDELKKHSPALVMGAGIEPQDGDKKDCTHLLNMPYLKSDSLDHFHVDLNGLEIFDKSSVHRPRNPELYQAPYCLLLTGLDMENFTMRAVYSDVSFVFKAVIYGIKGKIEQKHILLNLTGLLNSSLFAYFNLMLGSFAGIEREKRLVEEVFAFPYVYRDAIASQVEDIQDLLKESFLNSGDVSEEVSKLNKIILEAYHLDNNEFINYALNIQIPQLADNSSNQIYRPVTASDLDKYSKPFSEYLSAVFLHSKKYVFIKTYPQIAKHYSAIEVVLQDERPENWIQVVNGGNPEKEMLARFSAHKINDLFFELKDVIYFEADSFYIIKTNQYKNWHPAIAKLDLAEIVDQILSRNGGDC